MQRDSLADRFGGPRWIGTVAVTLVVLNLVFTTSAAVDEATAPTVSVLPVIYMTRPATTEIAITNTSDRPITFGRGSHGGIVGVMFTMKRNGERLRQDNLDFAINPIAPEVVEPGQSVSIQFTPANFPAANGRSELWIEEYDVQPDDGLVARVGMSPLHIEPRVVAILEVGQGFRFPTDRAD